MNTFAERLHAIAKHAERDPAAAWDEATALATVCTAPGEILALGALAAQVGGTALGRFSDAAAFVTTLRTHPATQAVDEVVRSLWRAEGVMRRLAGEDDAPARSQGITSDADACRYAGVLAQTFAARGRLAEALPCLREAAERAAMLPIEDPVVAQTALVAHNIGRMAQHQARLAHDLVEAAAAAAAASDGRSPDWRRQHLALFAGIRSLLTSGRPGEALRGLHRLMDLEDRNGAGPFERFHTAALACRAYHARGDRPQTERTLEACRDFARRASAHDLSGEVSSLERLLEK